MRNAIDEKLSANNVDKPSILEAIYAMNSNLIAKMVNKEDFTDLKTTT